MISTDVFKKIKNFGKRKNSIEFESIKLGVLLTEDFIDKWTNFSDFDQMIYVSGIKTKNNSFSDVFISKEWNDFVSRTTEFNGWDDMIKQAVKNYILHEWNLSTLE